MLGRTALMGLLASLSPLFAQAPGKGLVIVLIGPPGGGKTTQSEYLKNKYAIPVLAGDELRKQAGGSTEKMNALLKEQVSHADAAKGFVIDGYPSTRSEADYLAKLVKEARLPSPIVIHLEVPDAEVKRRMKGKMETAELERQLAVYHQELEMVRNYYAAMDIWTIIGTRTPKEVFGTIVSLIQDRQ
jgi:adenylate kinase